MTKGNYMTPTTNEIIIKSFEVLIAFICVVLQQYRMQRNANYAKDYEDNTGKLWSRIFITKAMQCLTLLLLWVMNHNYLDSFISVNILTPGMIILNLYLFGITDWMRGLFILSKGVYYCGLTVVSAVQYFLKSEDAAVLALGFTMSLAIFEAITAISDGYIKMRDARE